MLIYDITKHALSQYNENIYLKIGRPFFKIRKTCKLNCKLNSQISLSHILPPSGCFERKLVFSWMSLFVPGTCLLVKHPSEWPRRHIDFCVFCHMHSIWVGICMLTRWDHTILTAALFIHYPTYKAPDVAVFCFFPFSPPPSI